MGACPRHRRRPRSSARAEWCTASCWRASCCRSSTAPRPRRSPPSSPVRSRSAAPCWARSRRPISTSTRFCRFPVGVLADTLGPRRILSAGSVVAGLGSLLFALAPTWEIAAAGRTLVGIGVSVAFIAVLKITAVWFPASRFATLNGVTMFAGNLGAVIAGAPLAWIVTWTSWRAVFVGLAVLSLALGVATWLAGARPSRGTRVRRGEPRSRAARRPPALDAGVARRPRQPRDVAGLLRQPRHRRQLSRLDGPVGGAVPAGRLRDVARRGGTAREPVPARRRRGGAFRRRGLRPPRQPPRRDAGLRAAVCAVVAAVGVRKSASRCGRATRGSC